MRQYSYDANGNQTDVKNTKTGQTESYTYDAENRLSKVSVTDKDGKTAVIQQNRYNGDGQRIQKVEGSKTTNYYYQDGVVSYTTDGDNSQTSQNLIGTDGNILATQRYGSDHTDYLLYHKDIQGSTTSLVKEDGSADATYRYTDFGETTINGDNKAENEVCYTGGIYDQRTGLYYLNARYYNPEDGGFLTEDAYRGETNEPDTQNLYVYCADNPINYIDSSGNKKKRVDFWNIAFKSNTQNYYAFNQNAPQKYAGYNDLYDVMDWTVGDLVTKKVETTWWRLQFWKGKYGATYVPKISNGCEIGLYYRTIKGNPHWYCAYDRNRRIRMRMSLYVGNRKLFTRDSKTSTDQGKAWWLTAFVFKEDMPGKDIYSKTTLRMTGTLWFPKTGKYAKQMQTLSNKLKKPSWNFVFGINVVILMAAGLLFGFEEAMYSIIFQFVSTQIIERFHQRDQRVTLFIVTSKAQLLEQELMSYTHHGVTRLEGQGCYLKENKALLYTVVGADEVKDVVHLVKALDSKVFINTVKSEGITGRFYQEPLE